MTSNVVGGLSLLIVWILSVLVYKGLYWPYRENRYIDLPNRIIFQKRWAVLLSLLAAIMFFTQFILLDTNNRLWVKAGYALGITVFILFIVNHYTFIMQKNQNPMK